MENPYAPPSVAPVDAKNPQARISLPVAKEATKPLIPAVIGLVTYGASSPYALVLCIEHYLRPVAPKLPISTRIAMILSIIGTIIWTMLSFLMGAEAVNYYFMTGSSMYGPIGAYVWMANGAFLIWVSWRVKLFRRRANHFPM